MYILMCSLFYFLFIFVLSHLGFISFFIIIGKDWKLTSSMAFFLQC